MFKRLLQENAFCIPNDQPETFPISLGFKLRTVWTAGKGVRERAELQEERATAPSRTRSARATQHRSCRGGWAADGWAPAVGGR